MAYTIPQSCVGCGDCQPQCPTGAIQEDNGEYWIEAGLCNRCEDNPSGPQCVAHCSIDSPMPLPPKKGRYKTVVSTQTSPDIFSNGKNNPFASSIVVWEACNVLAAAGTTPWELNDSGEVFYQKSVKQGKGHIQFQLTDDLDSEEPQTLTGTTALDLIESVDIRSACLHLIYAAYTTTLEHPWEQEFVISDQQIEQYLGLDKRKDLSKATKLSLIKFLARQPCQLLVGVDWPQQGRVKGFSFEMSRLWHLKEIEHHFQTDEQGNKYLIGLTFRIQPGLWAKYFLNKQNYRHRTAFYQYGTLPQFILTSVVSLWQQHPGAVRVMLWLLFKTKMGQQQCLTVPTLMRVAYGEEKMAQAYANGEQRKRLIRSFEGDLETLYHFGMKPQFDPVTYPPELQPFWSKIVDLPDDAEAALDFWIEDGSQSQRLTDASPRGKWNQLMKAKITQFELPPDWEEQLAKLEKKKQARSRRRIHSGLRTSGLSSEQIVKARKQQGMSQRLLAQKAGKSQSWIRDLEKGRFSAKPEDQLVLRQVLGLHQG